MLGDGNSFVVLSSLHFVSTVHSACMVHAYAILCTDSADVIFNTARLENRHSLFVVFIN